MNFTLAKSSPENLMGFIRGSESGDYKFFTVFFGYPVSMNFKTLSKLCFEIKERDYFSFPSDSNVIGLSFFSISSMIILYEPSREVTL